MKRFDFYRMRRGLAVLAATLAVVGIVGSAAGDQTAMYRMSQSVDGGIGSGGGVPAAPLIANPVVNGTNITLSWYGLQGWYTVQGATSASGPWNNLTSVEATAYASQVTLPDPDTTNGYSFFQLYATNSFLGSSACGGCHGSQYNRFTVTAHANAYNALAAIHENNNSECILCHTVGNTQPTGFTSASATPNLEGVGCEDCHGAAAWHKNGDHDAITPVVSLDPMICGSCHTGFNPQYDEYITSPHYLVEPEVAYGINGGVYYPNTITVGATTYYGYYVTTNSNGTLKTNATSGILNSSHIPGTGNDPGWGRQTSCGVCHSGAARMAMLDDYNLRAAGFTNPLVLPTAADAGAWGATCANCHDPHGLNPSPVLGTTTNIANGVTNIGLAVVGTNWVQLRNPLWSSNFYTMASQSDERVDSLGNQFYMNTTFSSMYDPTVNVCGQCHNTRGARWDGRGYGLITNSYAVTNYVVGAAYTNQYTTNYNQYGQIVGVTTNTSPTGGVVTNAVATNVLVVTTGLTTTTNGFSRQPHLSPQYNMLIGILQPDYLNTTNGSTLYTNGVLNNGIGIYATHSGIKNRSPYNTNQCATCHVPSYTASSGANVSGHTFAMDPNGCALGGCHTSGWPDWVDYQVTTTNNITGVVDLLNTWATNYAPAIFTNFNKYQGDSWEYTSVGSLGTQGGTGPSTSDQLLLPTAIQQARFDVYMVAGDGSYGVHNPTFIPLLLRDAEGKILSQFVTAKFSATSTTVGTNATITFTNLNPGVTAATWNFGDGVGTTNTTAQTVKYAYANPGTYSVTLTNTDSNGTQVLTRNNYINVYVPATATFTTSAAGWTTNLTDTVTFTSTGANAAYASWSLYDSTGTISTAHRLFAGAGLSVSYTYTNLTNSTPGSYTFPVVMKASSPGGSVTITNSISLP